MKILTKSPLATSIEPELLGDIEKRLDPFYYCHLKPLPKIKSEIVLLKEICNINPKREVKGLTDDMMVPYIGLPNTDEHIGTVINVEMRPYKEVKGRNIVFEKDILFARIEPSIYNRKYIYVDKLPQKYAFISTEFHVLEAKKGTNPKYIFWIIRMDFVYNQVFGKVKGTTGRRRLDKSELEEFKIPFPQAEIRDKIVKIMESAHHEKINKIKKSKELIGDLNRIVLNELGIKLPVLKNKKIYMAELEEDPEKRIEPFFYHPKYIKTLEALRMGKYSLMPLGKISKTIASGATPLAKGEDYTSKEEGVPFIRIVDIKDGEIDFTDVLYIKREVHEEMLKRSQLKPNDILLSIAGTIGVSTVVPDNIGEANINQALAKISLKNKIKLNENEIRLNPYYVSAFLNSDIGQILTERFSRPIVQANINLQEVSTIEIPIPPSEIQNKIANEVNKRKEESKRLKKEAEEVVKKAKKEVEKLIIGKWSHENL